MQVKVPVLADMTLILQQPMHMPMLGWALQSNQNRAARDPGEFAKHYMQGMQMSGLM